MKRREYIKKVDVNIVPAVDSDGVIYKAKKKKFILVPGEEDFYMVFHHITPVIEKVTRLSDLKLLLWVAMNAEFNKGTVYLNKGNKLRIEKDFDMSQTCIKRGIRFLKDNQILIPISKGFFYVNPAFFWRGGKDTRLNLQKLLLEMEKENNLPDKEKKELEDIKRYVQHSKKKDERIIPMFDFSKIKSAS